MLIKPYNSNFIFKPLQFSAYREIWDPDRGEGQKLAPCWASRLTFDTFMAKCQARPLWREAITIPRSGHLNWSLISGWTQGLGVIMHDSRARWTKKEIVLHKKSHFM